MEQSNPYIKQFPELMKGKKIMYVHGFGSSGQSGTVTRIREVFPNATVIAPDLPIRPQEALDLFSKHESYADVNEEKRGSYQREYMALSEYYDVYEKGVINQSISMEDIKQLPGRESE